MCKKKPFVKSEASHPTKNREAAAGWFSRVFLIWLSPLLVYGAEKDQPMDLDNIGPIFDADDAKKNADTMQAMWDDEIKTKGIEKAHMKNVYFKFIGRGRLSLILLLFTIFTASSLVPPQLTKLLLNHIAGVTILDTQNLWGVMIGIFICPVLGGICQANYLFLSKRVAIQIYGSLTVLMYRKGLRITNATKGNTGTGRLVNMMAADAYRSIERSIELLPPIYILPIQFFVVFGLLVDLLNYAMVTVVVGVVIILPINVFVFMNVARLTTAAATFTDQRIKLINELLNGIRVVKFYGWEVPFFNRINEEREKELKVIMSHAYWMSIGLTTVFMQVPSLLQLGALVTYTLTGGQISPAIIFVALPYFQQLQSPLSQIPMALNTYVQRQTALGRIGDYLKEEELALAEGDIISDHLPVSNTESLVSIQNGEFTWTKEVRDAAVACGADMAGRVKHMNESRKKLASIQEAEMKKAAKGRKKPAEKRGSVVEVEMSAKKPIKTEVETNEALSILSNLNFEVKRGELIGIVGPVGSGKSSLVYSIINELLKVSGKIKVQGTVALAEQQAWIMNATARDNILFGKPFDEKKYDETVFACSLTSDFAQFIGGDQIQIGEKGINMSGGQKARINLARTVYADSDIVILDDPLAAVDTHVADHLFNECIKKKLAGKTRLLVTNQLHRLRNVDRVFFLSDNTISEIGTYDELIAKGGKFALMTERLNLDARRRASTGDEGVAEEVEKKDEKKDVKEDKKETKKEDAKSLIEAEERASGLVGMDVYYYFIRSVGKKLFFSAFFLSSVGSASVASLIGSFILADWTVAWITEEYKIKYNLFTADAQTKDSLTYLWHYSVTISLGLVVSLFASYLMAHTRVNGSRKMHYTMLEAIVKSPVAFFDTTPIGRVLNRFASDMGAIDFNLSIFINFAWIMVMSVFTCLFAIIKTTSGSLLVLIIPVSFVYYYIAVYIQSTQIKCKRLEANCRSPIYSNFGEMLVGLSTIRAYRVQERFLNMNLLLLNNHMKTYLTSNGALQAWMTVRLNSVSALLSLAVCICAVYIPNLMNVGELGVALSYSMAIVQLLSFCITMSTEVQSQMNSVERVMQYGDNKLEMEAAQKYDANKKAVNGMDMTVVPPEWPTQGKIDVEGLVMGYRDGPDVIKGLNISIQPAEKIGIVGRTGSGKSSLMIALFRISEARKGRIIIDGIDVATVGLNDLRSKLGIIPQDPVIFSGTLRYNLDPFDQSTDEQIWRALEDAHLKTYVSTLEGGLSFKMDEGGTNFSVGQRQLVCIARALLRNPKVLVLDEATASIDSETDKLLQGMVRTKFKDKTVLTIAHRLDSIMDSDKILVMNYGVAAEFDSPLALLDQPGSIFKSLVDADGPDTAQRLINLALASKQQEKSIASNEVSPSMPMVINNVAHI